MKLALSSKRQQGVTLIELIVVVAIIGILAAVVMPLYTNYMYKSRRGDARTALLRAASIEEQYYTTNNKYTNDIGAGAGVAINVTSANTALPTYTVKFVGLANLNGSNPGYTLIATPINLQVGDACGIYELDAMNVQQNTGNSQTNCC